MNRSPGVLVVAAEPSGDLHAAAVVRAVRESRPASRFYGIGGDALRAEGMDVLVDAKEMAVMGLSEVLHRYAFLRRVFHRMLREARERRPDAVLLVDYPGFNLRFAARAKAEGFKVVYYVCPQVWAWHRSRIDTIAANVDRLLTLFPFEEACFKGTGLRVDFVGHPLVDESERVFAEPAKDPGWKGRPRLALLPGSRRHEIARILPCMGQAAERLCVEHPDLSCLIAAPGKEQETWIRESMGAVDGTVRAAGRVAVGCTRDVLRTADAALVASGTATVEAALMGCPMVVVYKVSPLTYAVGRALVRVPYIGMVNIIAGREVCPERIQHAATPAALATAVAPLLSEGPCRDAMLSDLADVRRLLGSGGAAARAATALLAEIDRGED